MNVIPNIDAQYGRPMTVFNATHGVNTVTPKLRTCLQIYVADAKQRTVRDLKRRSRY